jgi:hypothetical protein
MIRTTMFAACIFLLSTVVARADTQVSVPPTPSSISPVLSFCIGITFHCVLPDLNLMAVNYDLSTKKWDGQVQSVGLGYALLFYSDKPYASGVALHGAGQFKDSGPKYFSIIPTLVFARYFEVGATFQLADGAINKWLTLGVGFQSDVLSGRPMASRHQAALSAYREGAGR